MEAAGSSSTSARRSRRSSSTVRTTTGTSRSSRRSPRPGFCGSSCASTASPPARRAWAEHRAARLRWRRSSRSRCRPSSSEMDRDSDNFTAELLLKELGAEVGAGGTTAAGAAVVRRDLAAAGVPLAGVRIVDGSGLSLDDRLTARALSVLLVDLVGRPGPPPASLGRPAGRRGERDARAPDAAQAGTRRRAGEDRHDERGVGALGLRRRPLRVRGAPERPACCDTLRRARAGPVRERARVSLL